MKAIIVCVDFADLLSITLPYNRHHFDEVMVVTTPEDKATIEVCHNLRQSVNLTLTRSFYEDGAVFNKWKALEEGLDCMGRTGWICIMDADVLWPKKITYCGYPWRPGKVGDLYTPFRRMWENWPSLGLTTRTSPGLADGIPPESEWVKFPLHRQQQEFAGYSQIFHASDPHLGPAPWHEIDWCHAGGADSFFQMKWPDSCKIRPPFEVLHLGPAGVNWCGRASRMLDGTIPAEAQKRRMMLKDFIQSRVAGPDRFKGEKLG